MSGKDKKLIYGFLIVLGIFFRCLYAAIGEASFEHFIVIVDGGLSGAGVATGIIFSGWVKDSLPKWSLSLIPYFCGGLAVLIGKFGVIVCELIIKPNGDQKHV